MYFKIALWMIAYRAYLWSLCSDYNMSPGAGGKQEVLGVEYANSLAPTVEIGGETYTFSLQRTDELIRISQQERNLVIAENMYATEIGRAHV